MMGFPLKTLKRKPWVIKVHDMIYDPTVPSTVSDKAFINLCFKAFVKASYGVFLKNLGKKADKVFVLTREIQSLLLRNGFLPDKVGLFPNGVDTQIFTPSNSKGECVKEKTILYIGSMSPEDGLSSLVRAFALLNPKEELNLTLIGNGPERLLLMELAKKLNLEQRVTFYRHVPHKLIPEFIRKAYVGVGPLRLSPINCYTIPTKILEYFACGKPVVSSPVSKDILVNESTGLVVKDATPKVIAKQFSRLLEDEKLARRMGRNARKLVVKRFDWEKIMSQIEKEIQEIESHRFA
jgi:glycosyltransferase involved in cell wall biosynthesis